jgi:SAM-dependent methyltransferase
MLLDSAKALWRDGQSEAALAEAWRAYDAAPDGLAEKLLLARILHHHPAMPGAERKTALLALVCDSELDPGDFSVAAWRHLLAHADLFRTAHESAMFVVLLEADALALALLREDIVVNLDAEAALAKARRWLLLSESWRNHPAAGAALIAQAALNGGAWPFDAEEREALADAGHFADAYLPARPDGTRGAAYADPVTRAVAAQYEGWPYPQWTRVPALASTTLAERVRELDPEGPATIPTPAELLIAGCGTGRQVVLNARRFSGTRITAIDISDASLRYAARRCAEAGVDGVDFRQLDLHDVAALGRRFDAIFCTGVLHHLPDPEKGWATLNAVLKPGGVMHVMVYSQVARLSIRALRRSLSDMLEQKMSDDLLRAVRQRLAAMRNAPPVRTRDFFSLAGVHDLLLHRHEDPFDVPRIRRALDGMGLRLIRFEIPHVGARTRYRTQHPSDPLQRDFTGWSELERGDPMLYFTMYDLWCRKP